MSYFLNFPYFQYFIFLSKFALLAVNVPARFSTIAILPIFAHLRYFPYFQYLPYSHVYFPYLQYLPYLPYFQDLPYSHIIFSILSIFTMFSILPKFAKLEIFSFLRDLPYFQYLAHLWYFPSFDIYHTCTSGPIMSSYDICHTCTSNICSTYDVFHRLILAVPPSPYLWYCMHESTKLALRHGILVFPKSLIIFTHFLLTFRHFIGKQEFVRAGILKQMESEL